MNIIFVWSSLDALATGTTTANYERIVSWAECHLGTRGPISLVAPFADVASVTRENLYLIDMTKTLSANHVEALVHISGGLKLLLK